MQLTTRFLTSANSVSSARQTSESLCPVENRSYESTEHHVWRQGRTGQQTVKGTQQGQALYRTALGLTHRSQQVLISSRAKLQDRRWAPPYSQACPYHHRHASHSVSGAISISLWMLLLSVNTCHMLAAVSDSPPATAEPNQDTWLHNPWGPYPIDPTEIPPPLGSTAQVPPKSLPQADAEHAAPSLGEPPPFHEH